MVNTRRVFKTGQLHPRWSLMLFKQNAGGRRQKDEVTPPPMELLKQRGEMGVGTPGGPKTAPWLFALLSGKELNHGNSDKQANEISAQRGKGAMKLAIAFGLDYVSISTL